MKRHLVAFLAVVALAVCAQAFAHHSFAATYLETEKITIEGEMVQFQVRNPHAYVHVVVTEKDGTMVRYVAEWGSLAQLSSTGVTKDSLRPGDHIIITGAPSRTATDYSVHLKSIRRPADGWSWPTGTGRR